MGGAADVRTSRTLTPSRTRQTGGYCSTLSRRLPDDPPQRDGSRNGVTGEGRVIDPRDFIRPPYVNCPVCGADRLGVLQIHAGHMIRRCRMCLGPDRADPRATVTLSKIRKRVLYLDQFALSNAMYRAFPEIDAARHERASRWREAFAKLQLLVRVQALVCPSSGLHVDEALPFAHSESLQRTWTMLSAGTRFDDSSQIEMRQLVRAAELWEAGEPLAREHILVDGVISPSPHGWTDVLHVTVGLDLYDGVKDDIAAARSRLAASLGPLFDEWAARPVDFEAQLQTELGAFGRTVLQVVTSFEHSRARFWSGSGHVPMPSSSVMLFKALERAFVRLGYDEAGATDRTVAFLISDAPHAAPKVRLYAALFAGLARKLGSGMKPATLTDGLSTDLKAVSAFLPYCDGIMVDGLVAGLLSERPLVDLVASHGTRVFSARRIDEFTEWLDALADQVDPQHLATVRAVYGDELVDAFVEEFARPR